MTLDPTSHSHRISLQFCSRIQSNIPNDADGVRRRSTADFNPTANRHSITIEASTDVDGTTEADGIAGSFSTLDDYIVKKSYRLRAFLPPQPGRHREESQKNNQASDKFH
jgi:hypothetical protein